MILETTTSLALAATMCFFCPPEDATSETKEVRRFIVNADNDAKRPINFGDPNARFIRVPQGALRTHNFMTADDQDSTKREVRSFRVEQKNDQTRVFVNGEEVPDKRFEAKDGKIIIYSEDGTVLHELGAGQGQLRIVGLGEGGGGAEGVAVQQARPRLGISMGALDSSLREHLNIDNEDAFIVTQVMEGMPAQEAGLQTNDIVVRVNGQSASIDGLRAIVEKASKGDEIRLRIVRNGEPKDIAINVDDARSQEVRVEEQDFDFDIDFDDAMEHDFDFDFDMAFDEDGNVDVEAIKRKVQEAMKDGRFEGMVDRLRVVPRLRELRIEDLGEFEHHLGDAQELPGLLMERFGPDSGVWVEIEASIEDAMGDLDPEVREKVEAAMEKARQGLRQRFGEGGRWRVEGPGEGTMTFELFDDDGEGGEEGEVIIFHERDLQPIRLRELGEGRGGVFELRERIETEENDGDDDEDADDDRDAEDDEDRDDSDAAYRMRRLEERMQRLERLLERLTEELARDRGGN